MEMLGEYRKHLPERLAEIRAGLEAGAHRQVHLAAHALKGVSLNLRVDRIARLVSALEEAGESGNLAQAGEIFTRLEVEVPRLEAFLKTIL
jgi:HPt (histidine-containing phosphotransfer) domain-containing protein